MSQSKSASDSTLMLGPEGRVYGIQFEREAFPSNRPNSANGYTNQERRSALLPGANLMVAA